MIVRIVDDRVQLITQPDHAHLAGRLMERCVALDARPRRDTILLAIAEHDNGWAEEDAAPTVHPEDGRIADFMTAPTRMRHAVWPRGVARLADQPWAAALVAQHALTIYERFQADDEWASFFREMEAARDAMVSASRLSLDALMDDYTFVRLADLISLTFCTGWTDSHRFGGWTIRHSGSCVLVTPDLFGGATISIEIAAKEIGNQPFASDGALRQALAGAAAIVLCGQATGTIGE